MTSLEDFLNIMRFHDSHFLPGPGAMTLDEYHEWNCAFAIERFKGKTDNVHPVTFFTFEVAGEKPQVRILETNWRSSLEKGLIFDLVRTICAEPMLRVNMVCSITEAWVANVSAKEMEAGNVEVRHRPNREDCLLVSSFCRDGTARSTRWVVKLKKDPAKNIMLARDDMDMSDGKMVGQAVYFFEPVRPIVDPDARAVPPDVKPGEPVNSVGSYYAEDGTLMNADGTRSIFDDIDK